MRKEPFFSFLRVRLSFLSLSLSLSHPRRRPIFGAALGFLLCSMPLQISPGPATQRSPSPSTKEITIGGGEPSVWSRAKTEKNDDALFGGFVFSTIIAESIALSEHPAHALLSFQNFTSRCVSDPAQQVRVKKGNIRPLPPEPRK